MRHYKLSIKIQSMTPFFRVDINAKFQGDPPCTEHPGMEGVVLSAQRERVALSFIRRCYYSGGRKALPTLTD
ncbi:hypothetical protein [Methyloglobulus sp.]|uniref:hypothetical protein n=1 Tax=Methyloglobulus sp. TaxID=2518622 RepID=UPI0032B728F5